MCCEYQVLSSSCFALQARSCSATALADADGAAGSAVLCRLVCSIVFSKGHSLKLPKCTWSFLEWRKQSWLKKLGLYKQLLELISISILQISSKCLCRGERNVKPWKLSFAQWPENHPANPLSCPSTVELLSGAPVALKRVWPSVICPLADNVTRFCNHCRSTHQSCVTSTFLGWKNFKCV